MSEWWTYRPSDFLLFSPRVYERLIEAHNAALWPFQPVGVLLGLILLVAVWRGRDGEARLALAGLGVIAAWVGWSFLGQRYAAINWAAGYAEVGFAVEAVALVAAGVVLRAPLATSNALRRATAILLIAVAVVAYPLLSSLGDRSLASAETFAFMPEPTAIATLGALATLRRRLALALGLVPLAWCLYAGMTLWTLGDAVAAAPLGAAALFLATLALGGRSRQVSGERLRSR
ncbi:DUF6064 family protein [Methylopila turkensis]|uniref:MFS transporter permease n=1 Tax=Methylopila turkensis TaxID=1437816 RepID=A0A9W6JSA7_9HYPH|nr:DUF6064 family protein [Methylopila turkensis]GLK80884.1 hypothetical protein GCM10008174_26250 [Methylopila turkensis]